MNLEELEELKSLNELDILFKIIEVSEGVKKRTEEVLHGKIQAGTDVRKIMQDVRLLAEILRDKIQIRKKTNTKKESKLAKAIKTEKARLKKEDERIQFLESSRKNKNLHI